MISQEILAKGRGNAKWHDDIDRTKYRMWEILQDKWSGFFNKEMA